MECDTVVMTRKKLRICIVTPFVKRGDGQGRANYEVVWEALRRDHHITLLAREVSQDLLETGQVNWVQFKGNNLPSALLREFYFAQKSAAWLRTHRQDFDIVQVYGSITLEPSDINTVQFVHTAWLASPAHISKQRNNFYGWYQWLHSALNAYWEKQAFNKATSVIAVSEQIREELVSLGVDRDKIHVILNGVNTEEFYPGDSLRDKLDLLPDVPIALFAGDIRTNRKNLDGVLKAVAQVSDLHLAVVGSLQGSPYPDLARELGISDRIHFLGFRKDIAQIMQSVDFFVFPSRYEACTLVLMEAMASGLPVITAKTTGGAEVVTSDAGIKISDPEDVVALIDALVILVQSPKKRQEMGASARLIAQSHSWLSKAKQYVDLFEVQSGQNYLLDAKKTMVLK
jgi:glycosyltransferase involved in cell wall biosynthesis